MINVYGLSYWMKEYVTLSLSSIARNASDAIDIYVVDNLSPRSQEIGDYCKDAIDRGELKKYIQMDRNVRGNALRTAYDLYPPEEEFFVFTDLDVVVSFDWISKLKLAFNQGYNIAGFTLATANYVPPNSGHNPDGIGSWLMGIRKEAYERLPKDVAYVDSYLRHMLAPCKQYKDELYHLGFDIWKDCPEYWEKHKTVAQPWHQLEMGEVKFIYG